MSKKTYNEKKTLTKDTSLHGPPLFSLFTEDEKSCKPREMTRNDNFSKSVENRSFLQNSKKGPMENFQKWPVFWQPRSQGLSSEERP